MRIVRQVIEDFQLNLDELHNDSTSVSVYGAYSEAEEEGRVRGRPTLAIGLLNVLKSTFAAAWGTRLRVTRLIRPALSPLRDENLCIIPALR